MVFSMGSSLRPTERRAIIAPMDRFFRLRLPLLCSALLLGCGLLAARPILAAPSAVLMVFGDSLSAEYGLARGSGWVALLDRRLQQSGHELQIVNASVSGETTAGGRSRFSAALARHRPRWVLIELGANDALRGLALESTEANLRAMVLTARESGAEPILIGMKIPPNFGVSYSERFEAVFARVAKSQKTPFVPFLLAGIADSGPMKAEYFQDDRIHPNARAQAQIADNVLAVLLPALEHKR